MSYMDFSTVSSYSFLSSSNSSSSAMSSSKSRGRKRKFDEMDTSHDIDNDTTLVRNALYDIASNEPDKRFYSLAQSLSSTPPSAIARYILSDCNRTSTGKNHPGTQAVDELGLLYIVMRSIPCVKNVDFKRGLMHLHQAALEMTNKELEMVLTKFPQWTECLFNGGQALITSVLQKEQGNFDALPQLLKNALSKWVKK